MRWLPAGCAPIPAPHPPGDRRGGPRPIPALAPFALSSLALALAVGGCAPESAPAGPAAAAAAAPEPAPEPAPRKVEAVPCRVGPVRELLSVSTTLEALHTVEVPARVAGRVGAVRVREGTRVRAGDPLIELDADDLRLAARERELEHRDAVERAATAAIEVQESGRLEEVQQLAVEKAEGEYRRLERLLAEPGRRAVSEEALEASRITMEQARVQKEAAALVTRRRELAAELAALAVERTRAAWDRAKLDHERATIAAPIGGDVTWLEVRPGELVAAGNHVATVVDRS